MSKITYPANSAYYATPQTSQFIGSYVYRLIPPNSSDTLITLTSIYNNRPDKLAFDLYGSPSYWWIFCIRNPFLRSDPIWGFETGINIYVPSASYLKSVLGS